MSAMTQVEVLRAACCVAMLDKELDDREFRVLQKLAHEAGVGAASLNAMIDRARRDEKFFEQQFRVMKADPDETMKTLLAVAVSDRGLELNERVVLHHFAQKLGMDDARFDQLLSAAEKNVSGETATQ